MAWISPQAFFSYSLKILRPKSSGSCTSLKSESHFGSPPPPAPSPPSKFASTPHRPSSPALPSGTAAASFPPHPLNGAVSDDLDLLLSLDEDGGEAVLETSPSSPRPADGAFTPLRIVRRGGTDMSVFREAVKDYLEATPASTTSTVPKRPKPPKSTQAIVDNYSGLRIKDLTVSPLEITNRFADIRFVRISAIKNLAGSDSFSGCWATAGVVLDKGVTRVSAQGKDYSIWKMGALDESEVSVFLFGDAHAHYSGAAVGAVFALFNGNLRMDNGRLGGSKREYRLHWLSLREAFEMEDPLPPLLEEDKEEFRSYQEVSKQLVPGQRESVDMETRQANGLQAYAVTLVTYLSLWWFGIFNPAIVYDHLGEIYSALVFGSFVFCIFLYIKGHVAPSSSDSGSSGNVIIDFYWL